MTSLGQCFFRGGDAVASEEKASSSPLGGRGHLLPISEGEGARKVFPSSTQLGRFPGTSFSVKRRGGESGAIFGGKGEKRPSWWGGARSVIKKGGVVALLVRKKGRKSVFRLSGKKSLPRVAGLLLENGKKLLTRGFCHLIEEKGGAVLSSSGSCQENKITPTNPLEKSYGGGGNLHFEEKNWILLKREAEKLRR